MLTEGSNNTREQDDRVALRVDAERVEESLSLRERHYACRQEENGARSARLELVFQKRINECKTLRGEWAEGKEVENSGGRALRKWSDGSEPNTGHERRLRKAATNRSASSSSSSSDPTSTARGLWGWA